MNNNNASIIFNNASTSTIAMAVFFGTILFTTASLVARLWLTGLWTWRNSSPQQNITSLSCIYSVLYYFSALGLILLYSYICEHHPPNYHNEKIHSSNRDEFYFLIVLVVVVAGGQTVQRNVDIMKKEQQQQRNKENNYDNDDGVNYSNQPNHQMTQQQQHQQQQQIWCSKTPPPSYASSPSVITATSVDENQGILNHCQIQELKGGIQIIFLLYQYYYYTHNNNANEMYNIIHVMNTAYLWLLGYQNFTYYYHYKANNYFALSQILRMIWQFNFLVLFTSLTHGNSYLLYYICPLHTYYFLMVYLVLYIGKGGNNCTKNNQDWIRIKLGILSVLIYLIWDMDIGLFDMLHSILFPFTSSSSSNNNESILLPSNDTLLSMGIKWEWYLRTYLDHWSTLLGMIFALNIPIISLYYQRLEEVINSQWMGKLAVIAIVTIILFLCSPWSKEQQYNFINPYIGWLPLLLYVYLRNIIPQLRSYSLELLTNIGAITMETYIMHHHIWLSSNSNTILVFIKGWPRINLVLVTTIFIILSRQLHTLTINLRDILLPNNNRKACTKSLIGLSVTIAGFYCTAYILEGMVIISLPIVCAVSIICGILSYQTVMDLCWTSYRKEVAQKERKSALSGDFEDDYTVTSQSERAHYSTTEQESTTDETIYSKYYPPLIGALVLVVLGLTWNEIAIIGASAIGPLPARCELFVNDGMWIEIDGCDESSRSMAYQKYGMTSYDRRCVPAENSYIWAWKDQPPHAHCRFGHRDEEQMKHTLNQREVVFIGDSMTRYIYHASMRLLNIKDSGAYDSSGPKHADISNTLWGTSLINFKWAPLAIDQLSILEEINNRLTTPTDEDSGGVGVRQQPDLIVLGGGAWDLLHLYATNEDRKFHAVTLNSLGLEMQRARELGIAIVWLIPTTINTRALNTDEKRDHMREEDMETMRWVYANCGVLSSATFIIDGPAFTTSRVWESYDGVHYPIQVYSAGAQILFNAMDWLLPPGIVERVIIPLRIGNMANPILGIIMLILVTIGLVGCDGFLGFSYLASIFVKGVMPYQLYREVIHLQAPDVVAAQSELQSRRLLISRPILCNGKIFMNRHRDNDLTSNEEIIELIK